MRVLPLLFVILSATVMGLSIALAISDEWIWWFSVATWAFAATTSWSRNVVREMRA